MHERALGIGCAQRPIGQFCAYQGRLQRSPVAAQIGGYRTRLQGFPPAAVEVKTCRRSHASETATRERAAGEWHS
jgi:hypothetical protein